MSIKSILKENGANLSKTSKASKLIASNASEVDLINNYVAYIRKGGEVDD